MLQSPCEFLIRDNKMLALQNVINSSKAVDESASNIANSLMHRPMPTDKIDVDFADPTIEAICGLKEAVTQSALNVHVAATIMQSNNKLFKLL